MTSIASMPRSKALALARPLAGLFSHPCGAWLSVERFRSGLPWGRPLPALTRRGVLGAVNDHVLKK